jgi:hypothetical protein
MTAFDPREANRFSKILGLLGSDHDGERAAAALKATEFLRARSLGWFDVGEMLKHPPAVVRPDRPTSHRASASEPHRHRVYLLQQCGYSWSDWERGFLASVSAWTSGLSPKQQDTLADLERKARDWLAKKGGDCDF